ncbi:hypothetical protein PDESU_00965 [Pontiella desulfatans]|uniref:SF3 helicase domain-containing protein n=1 Tax=Pontiella desulfatans TaxID=2750659 RepID=A0A6C2TXU2_PONDE|nr:hypothetical protein [Pontiella desulfatans]VGO12413.1 hypothetical protein PDESU_00965 [Pontiella desulfatans]
MSFIFEATRAGHTTNLTAYYDITRKEYLVWNGSQWIHHSESQLKRRLRQAGISAKPSDGLLLSAADSEILRVQDNCAVSYAGPLAGYNEGITEQNGNRVLVTLSPQLLEPVKGGFDVLLKTIKAILDDPDQPAQLLHFFGWLQWAVAALRSGSLMPGQALVMAGPVGCGKSLLQNLFTIIFGGRSAKPYQYMIGGTDFNSELFAAEHLMIEDEAPSTDYRSRRKLGSFIKQITVNQDQRFHAKKRDALMLKPFWRLSITLNDEPEDLHVLPPLDAGVEDKLIILRAFKRELPMPATTRTDKKAFWETLLSEIPAFLYWLLNSYKIPDALTSDRFGIAHYHNPDLITSLHTTSNEAEFLSLVEAYVKLPYAGTAANLEKELRQSAGRQADKLLFFAGAAGTYLARLSNLPNPQVIKQRSATENRWRIVTKGSLLFDPPSPPISHSSGGGGTL